MTWVTMVNTTSTGSGKNGDLLYTPEMMLLVNFFNNFSLYMSNSRGDGGEITFAYLGSCEVNCNGSSLYEKRCCC